MESWGGLCWEGPEIPSHLTPCRGQGHLPLSQLAPSPTWPGTLPGTGQPQLLTEPAPFQGMLPARNYKSQLPSTVLPTLPQGHRQKGSPAPTQAAVEVCWNCSGTHLDLGQHLNPTNSAAEKWKERNVPPATLSSSPWRGT